MTTKGDAVDPGQAGKPDLAAWRAEAGAALEGASKATPGPWRECLAEQGGCQCCTVWSTPDDIPVADTRTAIAYEDKVAPEATMRADARFIAAARTGWPRDAARVAALCERVAALEAHVATLDAMKAIGDWQEALAARCEVLEAALSEALDEFEDAIQYKLEYLVTKHGDRETLARLRAIAAGTAGEEPTK